MLLHALLLFVLPQAPERKQAQPSSRLQARLPPLAEVLPVRPAPLRADKQAASRKPVLALDNAQKRRSQPTTPHWTVAERREMNDFLDELSAEARVAPTLAQRSLARARDLAREQAAAEAMALETLERLPNSPPVDAFGLEMYMEALLKKLNRSAQYVRNDPRSQGLKVAAVQVRLNSDGSLKHFRVLNAADQQDEIEFIRRVVTQAVPFAAFPEDLRRSAQSLSMIICIMPSRTGGGGFGFTRNPDGRACRV